MSESFYNKNANKLADSYLSKTFGEAQQPWLRYLSSKLNKPDVCILDFGAVAGHYSKYLTQHILDMGKGT